MIKFIAAILTAASLTACASAGTEAPRSGYAQPGTSGQGGHSTLDRHIDTLEWSYPGFIKGTKIDSNKVWIVMKDGKKFLYDDGRAKTIDEKMNAPDLEDTFSMRYSLVIPYTAHGVSDDAGRIRHDGFLKSVYGSTPGEVRGNLVSVSFCGKSVRFNKQNGAAAALGRVSQKLCPTGSTSRAHLNKLGGTFNWRKIAGTSRLSAHSYAISIDLNSALGGYWRWGPRDGKKYPDDIVRAFQDEGFIWGGKWHHYDLMHFEYRPELINMGKRR